MPKVEASQYIGDNQTDYKKRPRALFSFLRSFFLEEEGQTTVEYILVLSVAVVGAAAIARTLLGVIDQGLLVFGGQLEKDLKTGRAPVNVWIN